MMGWTETDYMVLDFIDDTCAHCKHRGTVMEPCPMIAWWRFDRRISNAWRLEGKKASCEEFEEAERLRQVS